MLLQRAWFVYLLHVSLLHQTYRPWRKWLRYSCALALPLSLCIPWSHQPHQCRPLQNKTTFSLSHSYISKSTRVIRRDLFRPSSWESESIWWRFSFSIQPKGIVEQRSPGTKEFSIVFAREGGIFISCRTSTSIKSFLSRPMKNNRLRIRWLDGWICNNLRNLLRRLTFSSIECSICFSI